MIVHLLAIGVIGGTSSGGGSTTPSAVPQDRTGELTMQSQVDAGGADRLTVPTGATVLEKPMDPSDQVCYALELDDFLEEGETFASVTASVTPEAASLGFRIGTPAATAMEGDDKVVFWCTIEPAQREDAEWAGEGTLCGIEVDMTVDSNPPKIYQRTAAVIVRQM